MLHTRLRTYALVAALVGLPVHGAAQPETLPSRHPDAKKLGRSWTRLVRTNADRKGLAAAFAKRGYRPPKRAHLLVARIRARPATPSKSPGYEFAYHSLGDTGFASSAGRYWPASSVKLSAAVGALLLLRDHGLDGRARLRFKDSYGRFSGTAERLYRPAIVRSSNRGYDRLVRIAGSDDLSTQLARYGLPVTHLACPYAGAAEIVNSPRIAFRATDGRRGVIAARAAKVAGGTNTTTLFEMAEVLRRVVLHRHLAPAERFPLASHDIEALRKALRRARSKIAPAARAAFGRGLTLYNKAGRYPYWDQLDVALIFDRKGTGLDGPAGPGKPRALVAASVGYRHHGESHRRVERRLNRLVHRALQALPKIPAGRWLRFPAR